MKFELKHTFDASVDTILEAFTDPAFAEYMKLHMQQMSDIKPVDRKESGGKLEWRLRCVPKPIIRHVGPKEVPPEALAFVQELVLERASKRVAFRQLAEHPKVAKHLECGGTITFRDVGGKTERTLAGELKVTNLPFLLRPLGGIAEKLIYSNAEKLLQEETQVFQQFMKERKPA
jgi:hypothetical protein